jgi:LysM repeat protein
MDTISRENNSILPVAGVVIGVIALLLSGAALIKLSTANHQIADLKDSLTKVDALEGEVRNATTSAEQAKAAADSAARGVSSLQSSANTAFSSVAEQITALRTDFDKSHAPKVAGGAKGEKGERAAPPVAGDGEYIVKSGDTGVKIAKANGVTVADLKAVNTGINWSGLKVGQKIKLPQKKA